jgi:hypothetical protein
VRGWFRFPCSSGSFRPGFLRQPRLDQRLIRHVALVGGDFNPLQHRQRQAQRYGGCRWLQVVQAYGLRLTPVQISGTVTGFPELTLSRLAAEFRDEFKFPAHDGFALCDLTRASYFRRILYGGRWPRMNRANSGLSIGSRLSEIELRVFCVWFAYLQIVPAHVAG